LIKQNKLMYIKKIQMDIFFMKSQKQIKH